MKITYEEIIKKTVTKEVTLKLCPCCGGIPRMIDDRGGPTYIKCRSCGLKTPMKSPAIKAVDLWNKREDD